MRERVTRIYCRYSTRRKGGASPVGDFHWLAGDLTHERLDENPYERGVDVGRFVRERYPRIYRGQGLEEVGVCVRGGFRGRFTIPRVRELGDGNLYYDRARRKFIVEYSIDLDYDERVRVVVLSLGLAVVTEENKVSMGMQIDASRTNMLFARGFADGFLRGDTLLDVAELELALRLSADVRSHVKDVLFGDGNTASQSGESNRGGVLSDGVSVLVADSAGSGKSVALVDDMPTGSQFARPDMVLSLNGRTVEVRNPDGAALSVDVGDGGVTLVNEDTGEQVRVPESASHVFFLFAITL